jgi:hypothetical protein
VTVEFIERIYVALATIGVAFLLYVLILINDYRASAKLPSPQNGRRGYFAAVLVIFGRSSFLIHGLLLFIGVRALTIPDPNEISAAWWYLIAIALVLDGAWWLVLGHLRRIRAYKPRPADAGK